MKIIRVFLLIIILSHGAGCQSNSDGYSADALPTLMHLPSTSPSFNAMPTLAAVDVVERPTDRPMQFIQQVRAASPSPDRPELTLNAVTATPAASLPPPSPTATITLTPSVTPNRQALPGAFVFGQSVQGRDLSARRFGQGNAMLMLVGGIHGGFESNTTDLINELISHFNANSGDILPGVTLVLIPALNPDGVAMGRRIEGRFNANAVDLNRNWPCNWEPVAYFQSREVSPGPEPFSEPETRALASLISDLRPDVVLFYHSAADGVYAGGCGGQDGGSPQMVSVLGEAAGYSYGSVFSDYQVTGTAPGWVGSIGIASADVELATAHGTEFNRNLRGIMAVQCWLLEQ
jgi:hypothetical protein